jgi:hypothetical protein
MAYAFVQDIASSWEQYERVAAGLTKSAPSGLILYLAGPTDEGFRIIALCETEAAFKRFQTERLQPAIAALRWALTPTAHLSRPPPIAPRHRDSQSDGNPAAVGNRDQPKGNNACTTAHSSVPPA